MKTYSPFALDFESLPRLPTSSHKKLWSAEFMSGKHDSTTQGLETPQLTANDQVNQQWKRVIRRRSFLKGLGAAGTALSIGTFLGSSAEAQSSGSISQGDAAILRFLAAAEIIESDLWLQYQEFLGVQDNEVSVVASKQIPGYPAAPTGGNSAFTNQILILDGDMPQYIHDNTEDELSHETFINAYLISKGYDPVSLDAFRNLPSSKATGANQVGRLTNLMELTVDTSWWTRYRSGSGNPDLGDKFPQAVPSLAVNKHPAIPRTDDDVNDASFLTAIAFTAGFHFGFIEQGGSSLYPSLAQRVNNVEVLRILLSIGPVETSHFQTWHDKAGNATPLTATDPVTGVKVTFTNLATPTVGPLLQGNLIMPEPTAFLSRDFPVCSIIRPTNTVGAAMGAVKGLMADGLFIGQSPDFISFLKELASDADAATRGF
jgi:hypothetical protein